MLRPRFQLVPVSILAFWLVMMALLVRREVLVPRLADQSFQASAVPDAPRDSWMGIYLADGQKIGWIHSTSIPELRDGEEGARLGLTVSLRTKILGEVTPVKIAGDAWASATNGLRDFDFTVQSGEHNAGVRAAIRDGVVDATFELEGERFPIEWSVDQDLFLWSGVGASNVYFPAMEEGDKFFIDAFDPVTLSKSAVLVRCVGSEDLTIGDETYQAKIIDMEYDTMTARAHIDARTGDVLRAETPLGITLQRIDPGEVAKGLSEEEAADFFGLASVRAEGKAPQRGAERMLVRISGMDAWTVVPVGSTQRAVDGDENTYEIIVPKPPIEMPAVSPDSPLAAPLAELLEGAESPWEKIERVNAHAASDTARALGGSVVNPLTTGADVRASRFAELASAAGFEVRMIAGLVWSGRENAFTYHVWPEVRLDRWYWVDPALDQFPADAARIQLSDTTDDWPRLMGLLRSLRIEVLEIE